MEATAGSRAGGGCFKGRRLIIVPDFHCRDPEHHSSAFPLAASPPPPCVARSQAKPAPKCGSSSPSQLPKILHLSKAGRIEWRTPAMAGRKAGAEGNKGQGRKALDWSGPG